MKKTFLNFSLLLVLFTTNCNKKSNPTPAQCSNTIANEYAAAIQAFAADPTNKTKCQNVVSILNNLVNCPGVTAVAKAEYEKLLKDNPCNGL